jgi:hypothetical protein
MTDRPQADRDEFEPERNDEPEVSGPNAVAASQGGSMGTGPIATGPASVVPVGPGGIMNSDEPDVTAADPTDDPAGSTDPRGY